MPKSAHFAHIMVDCFIQAKQEGLDLIPVVADSTSTSKIKAFMDRFPLSVINVGIAEQAMVGVAAGLAMGGKVAATCNAAPFLISRANEQVKIDICYNNANVKMFGLNAGTSYGPLASTHHSLDDISIMRGFGHVEIYAPSCPIEAKQIIDYALRKTGPVYIRMDGKNLPNLHREDYIFKPGHVDILRQGENIAILALGSAVHEAVSAADYLAKEGINIAVLNLSSIRPLDRKTLAQILAKFDYILTVEEHNLNGGMGSIIAETIAEEGLKAKLYRYGIQDGHYAPAADRAFMRAAIKIDAQHIMQHIKKILK